MDKTRLQKLAGLVENMSPTLQSIAEEVFTLAEARAANNAGDQQGHGFDRNAVMAETDKIFIEIKAHIDFKLRNHKF